MKILMVLTSRDALGNTGRKTGFWLEEGAATGQNPASSTAGAVAPLKLLSETQPSAGASNAA